MILYYTGTGNSEYVAKRIAQSVNDSCLNLFEKLRNCDYSEISSESPFVIVCPTYGWQIPRILREWLKKTKLSGTSDIYFVMTCGGEIGNATKYLAGLCKYKGMNFKGCAEIVMPENYIALFDAPEETEALKIIQRAEPTIDSVADYITHAENIPNKPVGMMDKWKSSVVNAIYYPMLVHAKKFSVSDTCIGCGKCVRDCVLNNIELVDGKPAWNEKCTHCMACICGCPVQAIEYGKASKGKPRYQCPKKAE